MKRVLFLLTLNLVLIKGFSQTATHTVQVTLEDVAEIEFSSNTTPEFTFNTADKYDDGIAGKAGGRLNVRSNQDWKVQVRAATENFQNSALAPGDPDMPCGILSVSDDAGTNYQVITDTDATLRSGNKGGSSISGNSFDILYKADPGYDYKAGVYTLEVVYTVSPQ